jgi:hypothetical protein
MLVFGRDPDGIAGADFLNRAAPQLNAPDTRHDMQGLSEGVRVPRGACARLESYPCYANACRRWRIDNWILPDRSGKSIRRTAARKGRRRSFDFHWNRPR